MVDGDAHVRIVCPFLHTVRSQLGRIYIGIVWGTNSAVAHEVLTVGWLLGANQEVGSIARHIGEILMLIEVKWECFTFLFQLDS